jgi:hypothetical protein
MIRFMTFCLLLAFVPSAADAAAKSKSEVEELIDKGVELREQGKDTEALEKFRKAYELSHGGHALAQLALAEQALGHWVDAEAHLKLALDMQQDPWVQANRQALEGALKTIQQRLGNLEIVGNVQGAEVKVSGAAVAHLPLEQPLRLVAGTAVIELSADGYWPVSRSVIIPAGGVAHEEITLAPLTLANPTLEKGRAHEESAKTPPDEKAVGQTSPVRVQLERESPGPSPFVWVAGGGALLGIGVGIAALVVREGHVSNFNSAACLTGGRSRGENCKSDYDAANGARLVSDVGFVVGAASAVAAAVLWLIGQGSSSAESGEEVTLTPWIGNGAAAKIRF